MASVLEAVVTRKLTVPVDALKLVSPG